MPCGLKDPRLLSFQRQVNRQSQTEAQKHIVFLGAAQFLRPFGEDDEQPTVGSAAKKKKTGSCEGGGGGDDPGERKHDLNLCPVNAPAKEKRRGEK